jgi:aldehyde dehydrogenase (NAD+)
MTATTSPSEQALEIAKTLGFADKLTGGDLTVTSPIDGSVIGEVATSSSADVDGAIAKADEAFRAWRQVPAPRRGEFIRLLGEELRTHKDALGRLVSIECGKIYSEGLGEVQEMIDICDFAVGQSRQLYGKTIATERPEHRMMETWHPLGAIGVITAFNFPVAVWSWNAAIALICGNAVVWKPSEKSPLTALAVQAICERLMANFEEAPAGLVSVIIGERAVGEQLVDDERLPLVSATGSCRMGREVGPRLAKRFARSLLELGGNNAAIVAPSADLDLAVRGIAFSAIGTAGQRCTSLRRLIVHEDVYDDLVERLQKIYGTVSIGNPLDPGTLVGPLIDKQGYEGAQSALAQARNEGGKVLGGERANTEAGDGAYYMRPALVEMPGQTEIVKTETFAPILYVLKYKDLDEAIALQNGVAQGLSSSIFTRDMQEAEQFVSDVGSDCGIANVNIGPSGAEIGGAFGGEKETGGGREAGSDSWKAYMRRATNTVNYGSELPLAQGVSFDV